MSTTKGIGRPKFQIDYELVTDLAKIHCTEAEIASVLGCSTKTLQRDEKFLEIYNAGIEESKASLRRIQFNLAKKNSSMAIFLGKQYLGQRDSIDLNDNDAEKVKRIQIVNDLEASDEDATN